MKTRIITLLTVCLFILSILSSCTESKTTEAPKGPETIPNPSSHSETKTEEVQRDPEVPRSDSFKPYIGFTGMEGLPKGLVKLYKYPFNPGYTLLEAIVTGDAESYFYSFPENEEEKAILYSNLRDRAEVDTVDREYALGQVELLYEVWETPQKFFAQDVKVQNVYGMSEIFGLYVYTITDRGDFVVFREYNAWEADAVLDTYVFPADEFEVFRKIQAEEWRSYQMKAFNFDDHSEYRPYVDYSIAKVIERSEYKDELPKYAAPFNIE